MLKFLSNNDFYQICKYCIAVGIGTGIDLGLFSLFITIIPLNYLLANAISFSLGTLVVYYIQKNWTFHYNGTKNVFIFGKYILGVGIYFLLTNLILIICISFILLNPIVSKIIQISITFVLGYIINKKFIFNK